MRLLTVPALGTGHPDADPFRPDIPAGTSFCGAYDAKTGTYLVAVPDAAVIDARDGRVSLTTARAKSDEIDARKLSAAAVDAWRVGSSVGRPDDGLQRVNPEV